MAVSTIVVGDHDSLALAPILQALGVPGSYPFPMPDALEFAPKNESQVRLVQEFLFPQLRFNLPGILRTLTSTDRAALQAFIAGAGLGMEFTCAKG